MEAFVRLTAIAAPIDQPDINTDMLIPVCFLRKPLSSGYGNFLFFTQRFNSDGTANPDFLLNREPYNRAKILVTGANFGCGSTREGAIYAILDFGIRAIIAPSYGPFHVSNSYQNGLLPIVLPDEVVRHMRIQLHAKPGIEITVDLPTQTVIGPDGENYSFEIEPSRKVQLLNGLDDIGITERYSAAITQFEKRLDAEMPWLAGNPLQQLVQK
ncbi:MAG: 3-isopropylmalate dehydratase small subunit [Candidatus Latescibacterota bacterium]